MAAHLPLTIYTTNENEREGKQARHKLTLGFKSRAVQRVLSGPKVPGVAKGIRDRREPAAGLDDAYGKRSRQWIGFGPGLG